MTRSDIIFLVQLVVVLVLFVIAFRFLLAKVYRSTLERETKKLPTLPEKKLRKRYKNAVSNRKNKFLAWYVSGILFYKVYRDHLDNLYQLYHTEMIRRGFLEE